MSFSQVKNVRIKSLTEGAVVQLRLGKAASKHDGDMIVEAKVLRHDHKDKESLVIFEERDADGNFSELVISQYPGANWRAGALYAALHAVDESTFTIKRAASPILTDAIGEAIKLIELEYEDVFAPEQLIALLAEIQNGNRINTNIKALATMLANRLVDELSALKPKNEAAVEE